MKLAGKVATITEAASGIGRATAILFAREGTEVVLSADRNVQGAQKTLEAIKAEGGEAIFVQTDVRNERQVSNMVAEAVRQFGRLDVICNFAGGVHSAGSVVEEAIEHWDEMIALNLRGAYLCCHCGIPQMAKNGAGSVVNMSAKLAIRGGGPPMAGPVSSYAAAKAGVVAMTNSVAYPYGHLGIRANVIMPGLVETGATAPLFGSDEFRKLAINSTPLRRWGQPEEVAAVALFFASDDSSYVSGQTLVVDGACHLSEGTVYPSDVFD